MSTIISGVAHLHVIEGEFRDLVSAQTAADGQAENGAVSRVLRAQIDRGERMYPTERALLLATSPPTAEVLRHTLEQLLREIL